MVIKRIETKRAVYLSFALEGYQHVLTVARARELAAELRRAADEAERWAGTPVELTDGDVARAA